MKFQHIDRLHVRAHGAQRGMNSNLNLNFDSFESKRKALDRREDEEKRVNGE